MTPSSHNPFAARQADIARLVAAIDEAGDHRTAEAARELVRATLALHADGLKRLLDLLAVAGPAAEAVVTQWTCEDLGRGLLLLHGLHPLPLGERLQRGLDAARRVAAEAGCTLEPLGSSDAAVSYRVESGDREVHPDRLRSDVESALLGWVPEIERIQIHGLGAAGLVQLHVSAGSNNTGHAAQPEPIAIGVSTHATP